MSLEIAFLGALFLLISILYTSVGLGGGTSYLALLALFSFNYSQIPVIALICNIVAVSTSAFLMLKRKQFKFREIFPFLLLSIPFSYIGGMIFLPKNIFFFVLGMTLLFASFFLVYRRHQSHKKELSQINVFIPLSLGAFLGLISGALGIGGGIFLGPILYFLGYGPFNRVPMITTFFILLNSLAGLSARGGGTILVVVSEVWPLFVCVMMGSVIGFFWRNNKLAADKVKALTALLVFFVSTRLLFKSF